MRLSQALRVLRSRAASYRRVDSDTELSRLPSKDEPLDLDRAPSWWRQISQGWRFGVLVGAVLATFVLVINLTITILALALTIGTEDDEGQRVLYEGDCDDVDRFNIVAHFFINVLSTLLLSSSNYAMQCLSAPTRTEVDQAHGMKDWLDIGVLSVRNLWRINRKRVVLWGLLAICSLPLHFLFVAHKLPAIAADCRAVTILSSQPP